jgi:hypothetical protein
MNLLWQHVPFERRRVDCRYIKTSSQHVIYARAQDGTNARSLQGSDFRIVDGRYLVYMSTAGELSAATCDAQTRTVGRSTALISGLRSESAGETTNARITGEC